MNSNELCKMVNNKSISDSLILLANLNPEIPANGLHENNQSMVTDGILCINVISGSAKIRVNGETNIISARDCICILTESDVEFLTHTEGFCYFSFLYKIELIELLYAELKQSYYKASMRHSYVIHHFESADFEYHYQIFKEISKQISLGTTPISKDVVLSYATLLFSNDFDIINHPVTLKEKEAPKDLVSKQKILFQQFIDLLNIHSIQERSVKFYASTLGITPKYLSALSINYSGKNASAWIDEYVISHAKQMLFERKYNIREVSIKLNFPSQSFFGRYFKRVTGISPKAFIEQNINNKFEN